MGTQQEQFLNVLDRDEAERRFRAVLDLRPLEAEEVLLAAALGRVLAGDVMAPLDVPSFDRANVDGFAVRAADTFGASEEQPRQLQLSNEVLAPGMCPRQEVGPGQALGLATGAMLPRGADAVVMIEDTDSSDSALLVRRPATPGAHITFAGTDIGRGETVLRRGELLTARETGVLAALGVVMVPVVRQPRVAIISTGDEIIAPGQEMRPGLVFDSNATILADSVRELGGEPIALGIVPDNFDALRQALLQALACDAVLLSGGTSKREGDLSYRVVGAFGPPGIVAHGIALKPGKPLCLAALWRPGNQGGRPVPVVILPGFPTSAIFTFHEFVAPVLRCLAGRRPQPAAMVQARLPFRVNSESGRTEYLLVGLVGGGPAAGKATADSGAETRPTASLPTASLPTASLPTASLPTASLPTAFPLGKGSGSVTSFSRADGFVVIGRQQEYLEAETVVDVHLLGEGIQAADLVVIGSHCLGLDYLLGCVQDLGLATKFLAVGSTGGLEAARRGECDLAGIHLLDPKTNIYNHPFAGSDLVLVPGYLRLQGIVYRPGDTRFEGQTAAEGAKRALADARCILVNRNRGSGTRVLLEQLLNGAQPPGYATEARSHNAVVAAVAQSRADWGVAIAPAAQALGLGFLPLQHEHYDFVVPKSHWSSPAVQVFCSLLQQPAIRRQLAALGFAGYPDDRQL